MSLNKNFVVGLIITLAIVGLIAFFMTRGRDGAEPVSAQVASSDSAQATAKAGAPTVEYWTKRCAEKDQKACEIFQRLIVKKNNMRLVEVAVSLLDNGQSARAGIVLPLGIMVAPGVALQVDEGTPHNAKIQSCTNGGCFALLDLPKSFVDAMRTGKLLNIGFLDGQKKQIKIEMSLNGFAGKLDQLK